MRFFPVRFFPVRLFPVRFFPVRFFPITIPTTPLGATKTKRLYADIASSSTSSKKDDSDVLFELVTCVIKNSNSADEKFCDVGGENKFMSDDNGGRKRSNFNKGNAEQRTAKQ